jgi:cytochrome P450
MSETVSTRPAGVPVSEINLHADEVVLDPYPVWRQLRDAGPVVWLEHHQTYVITRYAELAEALTNWKVFSSGHGVAMNEIFNTVGSTLNMDPPEHDRCRRFNGKPLQPNNVRTLEPRLREVAEQTIVELKRRERFDGVSDLASVLPLNVVRDLVGLPEEGREKMLEWAAAGFNAFGLIEDPRTQAGLAGMLEANEFMQTCPGRLTPGSWGDDLVQAEQRGELGEGEGIMLINDYIYPSLDTTIHALSAGLKLFADNPDQWDKLRADRSLIPNAVSEVVRLSCPIQWFCRYVTEDYELGGVELPAGSRTVVSFASANRDERRFPDPDRFDITRKATEQLGFGRGKHACLGMPLARLEIQVVLDVMADHVERIETGAGVYAPNTTLHGLESLEVTFH